MYLFKKIITFLVPFVLLSCSPQLITEQPLHYSYLPNYLDVDSILPNYSTQQVVDSTFTDFDPIALDSGKLITIYKDTIIVPPGILISEKNAALSEFYKSNYRYQFSKSQITRKLLGEYYKQSYEAETRYQQEIKDLKKEAKRSWLEQHIVYIGFIAGIITTVITEFAVIQVAK